MRTDVVVVGAGIQGASVALRLAQAGRRVIVLERAIPGAEASSAAGGILSPGVEALEPGPFYALCRASLARYAEFVREVEASSGMSVGYRALGTLEVALDDDHARVLAGRAEKLEREGLPVEVLDGAAVRALEPGLSEEARGALFFADEASLDPRPLARAVYVAASRAGATFVTGEVRRIRTEGGRATGVDHAGGRIDAGAVVLAAGSWSLLVEGHGLPAGAVRPVRGQIAVVDTRPPLLSRVVFSGNGYVVPRADGRILCGSTMEDVGLGEGGHRRRPPPRPRGRDRDRPAARAGAGRRDLVELPAGEPRRRADPRRGDDPRALLRDGPHAERDPPRAHHRRRDRRRRHGRRSPGGPVAVLARAARRHPRLAVSRGRPRGRGRRPGGRKPG